MGDKPSEKLAAALKVRGRVEERALKQINPALEFKVHFPNPEIAAKFEKHANKGDLYALERLYRLYSDNTVFYHYHGGGFANSSYIDALTIEEFGISSGGKTYITDGIYSQLKGKSEIMYDSANYINSGRREYKTYLFDRIDGIINDYSGWDISVALDSLGVNGPGPLSRCRNKNPETNEAYLNGTVKVDLRNLTAAAEAGNASAATYLAGFYSVTSALTQWWGILNKTIKNPYCNPSKTDYWKDIQNFLSGRNDRLYAQYVEDRLKDPEGMYNVAIAILNNPHVRKLYNQHHGIAGDSDEGARDILRNAVNLGNANAAWQLARLHHEQYIITDSQSELQQLYYWYSKAADMGHKEGVHNIAYFKAQFPDIEQSMKSLDLVQISNPSAAYLQKRPDAEGEITIPVADIAFVKDKSPGMKQRLEDGVKLLDKELVAFDRIIHSLEEKIRLLLDTAQRNAQKQAMVAGREDQIHNRIEALREIRMALMEEKPSQLAEDVFDVATGVGTYALTGSPIILGRAESRLTLNLVRQLVAKDQKKSAFESYLDSKKMDISLVREEVAQIDKAIVAVRSNAFVKQLQKDELSKRKLLSAFLKKTLLKQGIDNITQLEPYAKQHAFESIDDFLAAIGQMHGKNEKLLDTALNNFVHGFADTKDTETLIAYANAHTLGNKTSPAHDHEINVVKVIVDLVENVIKPHIDHYYSTASRVDVLKAEGFNFSLDPNAALTDKEYKNPTYVGALLASEYSVVGSREISKIFDYYMHRHGKHVIYDPSSAVEQHPDKTVDVIADQEVRKYADIITQKSKHGDRNLPAMPNLFMKICAEEYLTPHMIVHPEPAIVFKDRPEAPIAYLMANDVVKDFIGKMSLSPLAKYRSELKDKSLVDNVIAQTFFDFFAKVGNAHTSVYASGLQDVANKYGKADYGKLHASLSRDLTRDTSGQYDLYDQLLQRNLQKALSASPLKEAKQLLAEMDELAKQGISIIKPSIIMAHATQLIDEMHDKDTAFSNMSPNAKGRAGK